MGGLKVLAGRKKSLPILWGSLKGMRLPRTAALGNLHMLIGGYEPGIVAEILSMPSPLKVAFDVGAHVGMLTLAMAKRVGPEGEVFAFEPFPASRLLVEQMIAENHLSRTVYAMPFALSDQNGEQRLVMGQTPFLHRLGSLSPLDPLKDSEGIPVRSSTIDSFVFDRSNPAPDLLKIDVEGAEVLVLKGAMHTLKTNPPNY